MAKGFRFSATRIYLTYSRTVLRMTPNVVLALIEKKLEKHEILQYLISVEKYAKVGQHIHAYFKFGDKLDYKNEIFVDLVYYGKIYHPNISTVYSWHKLMEYIKKDGEWISNIDETRPTWKVNLEESKTKKEFLENMMWEFGSENTYTRYRISMDLWKEKEKSPVTRNRKKKSPFRDEFPKEEINSEYRNQE